MRKYGKWLLMMGVLAASPSFVSAQDAGAASAQASAQTERVANQRTAEQIGAALQAARINGYDIEIEVDRGVARLIGKVREASHKVRAERAAATIPGVRRVQNELIYVAPSGGVQAVAGTQPQALRAAAPRTQTIPTRATAEQGVRTAQFEFTGRPGSAIEQVSGQQSQAQRPAQRPAPNAPAPSNQQVAQSIGNALSNAGFVGYDIEIRCEDGNAVLAGEVASPQQAAAAGQIASGVPGVRTLSNQLRLSQSAQQPQMRQASYQNPAGAFGMAPGQVPPGMMQQGMMPPGMMQQAGMMQQGMSPTSVGTPISYNTPHLPDHAWPAYAQYPNSAAVTYPTQYSASAWPYIGPFYPYPQVPEDWREVTLEWDDGYWQIDFDNKTERWWWFLQPKNWGH